MVAGRRGGKTKAAGEIFVERVFNVDRPRAMCRPYWPGAAIRGRAQWWDRRPRQHYWVVSEINDLLDESKRALLDALPGELIEHADNAQGRWWLYGDILIEFKSGHDPKRLVSAGLDGMWIEEGSRLRADAWPGFLRPCLSDKGGWAILTTTPLGRDWTYEHFYLPWLRGERDYEFVTWRTLDNPLPSIQEEVELARRTLSPEHFRREYEASYDAFVGQIYSEFSRKQCEYKDLPKGIAFAQGCGAIDWGWAGAGSMHIVGRDTQQHVWVLAERYEPNLLVEDYWIPEAHKLGKQYGIRDWIADPEAPDNIERFNRAGLVTSPHTNFGSGKFDEHSRSVLSGVRLISSLIHRKKLHIHESCVHLLAQMESYHWASVVRGQNTAFADYPAANQEDHACDSSRYGITWLNQDSALMLL